MSRSQYFYIGLLMIATGSVLVFTYRTYAPPIGSTAQTTAQFGGVSLTLDYATTEEEREKGLGGRTSIPNDYGMLFVFPNEDRYGFWMKDMLVPIDIFWLDIKGQVVFIANDVAPSSYPDVFYPTVPAQYVLETVAGFAREHTIATGTPLLLKNIPSVLK